MSLRLKDKLIKTLLDTQKISKKELDEALLIQKEKKISLDKILISKGLIKEKDLLMLLVRELNIPFINLSKYRINPDLKEVITEKVARQYNIIPLSILDYTMTVALADPLNVFAIDDLKNITGKEVDIVMSTNEDIKKAIDEYYGVEDSGPSVANVSKDIELGDLEIVVEKDDGDAEDALDESKKAPIIRMVNLILQEALRKRASDIHIEPTMEAVRVRFRIDGVLQDVLDLPKGNQNAIIVRIKIMARLDITMSEAPQDGRFRLKINSKEVDFRVSLLPTTYGQKIVMRVLDKSNLSVGITGLGLTDASLDILKDTMAKPFGMMLVTGPTGSGKSTTLYSVINELNTPERNIITVEDPVEYQVDGLTQIQAHAEIGLTFAAGLRSILRQSPDVVMVGEIRDGETADIAIKAALTGQLVLSTLHTNDATGALTRLIDMGVEPFLVASSIVTVSAQRLCRKICNSCKQEIELDKEEAAKLDYDFKKDIKYYDGKGCEACNHSGYLGRMCITEMLIVDDDVRELVLEGKSSDAIKEFARANKGLKTLFEDAMLKCEQGFTSFTEVLRVTSEE
ncbi:MAG: type IV pilus assembly protein PilB [Lysobacterales bacterium]|jgi:type IV pilus assembly protein PilB